MKVHPKYCNGHLKKVRRCFTVFISLILNLQKTGKQEFQLNSFLMLGSYLLPYFGKGESLFGEVSTNSCKNSSLKFFIFFFSLRNCLSENYIYWSWEEAWSVFHEQKGLHFD